VNDFGLERARRLEILKADAFKIFARGQPFDPVGVALVCPLVVPEPVLSPVGGDDERGRQVLCVTACLLLGVVGVERSSRFASRTQSTRPRLSFSR